MGNCCPNSGDSDERMAPMSEPFLPKSEHGQKVSVDSFNLLKVLGEGSFGKVYLVEKKNVKKLYAMKVLKKSNVAKRNQKFNTKVEREILANMFCPFLVRLHYAFQTKDKLYLVMDFMSGGELFTHLRMSTKFSEARVKFYAAELLLGLEYLHNHDIVYRDLKPENILLDEEGHLKITDFGLSKQGVRMGYKTYTLCGTPEYLAPEILLDIGHDRAVDFWSYGALIYEMLSGAPPFYHRDRSYMFKLILEKPLEMKSYFSKEAVSLLKGLLAKKPTERLSNAQDIKKHEFFSDVSWPKVQRREIKPPLRPKLKGDRDLTYFDKQFTEKTVKESPATIVNSALGDSAYAGFTYDPNIEMSRAVQSKETPSLEQNSDFDVN